MPSFCSVNGCKNNSVKRANLKYHGFPSLSDPDIRKKWLEFCERPLDSIGKRLVICAEHFEPSAYQRDLRNELLGLPPRIKLIPGALPTIKKFDKVPLDHTLGEDCVEKSISRPSNIKKVKKTKNPDQSQSELLTRTEPELNRPMASRCLFCFTELDNFKPRTAPTSLKRRKISSTCTSSRITPCSESDTSSLSKQLHVIFILKKILKIPTARLQEFMEFTGGKNPEEWICLCEGCDLSVENLKTIYEDLRKISKKFQETKECLLERLKVTENESESKETNDSPNITMECRKHILKKNAHVEETGESEALIDSCSQIETTTEARDGVLDNREIYFTFSEPHEVINYKPNWSTYRYTPKNPEETRQSPKTKLKPSKTPNLGPAQKSFSTRPTPDSLESIKIKAKKTKPSSTLSTSGPKVAPAQFTNPSKTVDRPLFFKCPFCFKFRCRKNNGLQFCQHLTKCKILFQENSGDEKKPIILQCPYCTEFECLTDDGSLFVEHVIWCHSKTKETSSLLSLENEVTPTPMPLTQRIFQCKLCPIKTGFNRYMNFDQFLRHYKLHRRKQRLFHCFKCDLAYSTTLKLRLHWRKAHSNEADPKSKSSQFPEYMRDQSLPEIPWWCPMCPARFNSDTSRDSHMDQEHNDPGLISRLKKFNCASSSCEKSFISPEELQLHTEIAHLSSSKEPELDTPESEFNRICKKLILTCSIQPCSGEEIFKTEKSLEHHRRLLHHLDLLQCEYCGNEFTNEVSFRQHIRGMHESGGNEKLHCDQCTHTFKTRSALLSHIRIVHKRHFPQHCHICSKGFSSRGRLQLHLAKVHKTSPPKYPCSWPNCKKSFHENFKLECHLSRHRRDPGKYKCDLCGKLHYTRKELNRHLEVHANAETKPYHCDLCPKRFAGRHMLYAHKRSHMKSKRLTMKPESSR